MCSLKLDVPNTFKKPERDFSVPCTLLAGAGPTNCSPRVLAAISLPTLSPLDPIVHKVMDDIQVMLRYVFQTRNEVTLAGHATGNGGMEAILSNLVDPGEKVIVAVGGIWGERCVLIAKAHSIDVVKLVSAPGEVFSFEELEREIIKHKPVLLFITQGESSGGTNQPLDGLGDICHKHNVLLAVDAVVSLGGVPFFMDRWGVDAVVSASQKAIAAPPGIYFLSFSPAAMERRKSKKQSPPFYLDVQGLGSNWCCFNRNRKYHYTHNANMLYAIREALAQIVEEGLENVWERHRVCSERFWKGVEKLNLELFVKKPENRLHTVTPVLIPKGAKWWVVLNYLLEKYRVDISFGIGPTANKAVRVGTMGYNARPEVVDYILEVLDDGIRFALSEEGQKESSTIPELDIN